MKLEFDKNNIPEDLYKELGFDQFLFLFDVDMPVVPYKIFKSMNKNEGKDYFKKMIHTEKKLQGTDFDRLVDLSREFISLEHLFPFFEKGRLEQYHIFEIGQFLKVNKKMIFFETNLPVAEEVYSVLDDIQKVLEEKTGKSFSVISAKGGTQKKRN